jgi:hypothetical protein
VMKLLSLSAWFQTCQTRQLLLRTLKKKTPVYPGYVNKI